MNNLKPWDQIEDAEKALVIRTCAADMTAHSNFKWPESGLVECPDWSPRAACGNGLHGLMDGFGDWSLTSSAIDAKWLLVEVARAECVELDGKVKFPRGNVIFAGSMADAMTKMSDHQIKLLLAAAKGPSTAETVSDEDDSRLAASGYASSLAASGYDSRLAASGYASRLAASGNASRLAASGNDSRLAASGNDSRLAASGNDSSLAASGNDSSLAASGNASRLAASGKNSVVAGAGYRCRGSAGEGGVIALTWWDEKAERPRVSVAYVGENGIKPNTFYSLDDKGKFVEEPG